MNRETYLNDRYKILSPMGSAVFHFPSTYIPVPTQDEFTTGFIIRNFAKKVNDYPIIEISNSDASIVSTQLYQIISVNWKISGPRNNIYKNNILDIQGAEEHNKNQVLIAEKKMAGIKNKLNNPLQFWQGY